MATGQRRKKMQAERKARKEAQMKRPGAKSAYAMKRRGIYPLNSPYRTVWADYA